MRLSPTGVLLPLRGFSRVVAELPGNQTAWVSHDGLRVISDLCEAHLPGSGAPPVVGPQWLISASRAMVPGASRCSVTDDDLRRVVECFGMPAWDEDNHYPGRTRQVWCPVDPAYRSACECKVTEVTITDGDYRWTTDRDGPCRGCEFQRMFGLPCTVHGESDAQILDGKVTTR
jgi:hypothetical protein